MVRQEALERARAARALIAAQQPSEGIRLALGALELGSRELPSDLRREARALVRSARRPRLDREVARADVEQAEQALAILEQLDQPQRARGQRWALVALAAVAGIAGLVALLRPAPPIVASASGSYDVVPDHAPSAVLDDLAETQWLMPDRSEGWIELRFASPRHVGGLVIRNGTNAPYRDRAVERIEVVLFGASGAMLASTERTLALGEEVSIEVEADEVARLRIYVRSFHAMGGAIEQVRVLP